MSCVTINKQRENVWDIQTLQAYREYLFVANSLQMSDKFLELTWIY